MIQTKPMKPKASCDDLAAAGHFAAESSTCDASDKGNPSSLKDAGADGPPPLPTGRGGHDPDRANDVQGWL